MSLFVDTSALYALMDAGSEDHAPASQVWPDLLDRDENLVCTNYILVETLALLQRRIGLNAVSLFQESIVPVLRVVWVDEAAHASGIGAMLVANRRQLSLVDCVSFSTMRRLEITRAFTFDRHFAEQGFDCVP